MSKDMVSEVPTPMTDNEVAPQAPTLEDDSHVLLVPSTSEMVRVGVLGLFVGVLTPLIAWLVQSFVIDPIFCRAAAIGICSTGDITSFYVATIITAVIAIALMANWQVFRPLLIAVAAAAAMWGLRRFADSTADHNIWEYYATTAVLFSLTYLLFYWLMRLKNFAFSVVLTVIMVALVRWALLV